MFEVEVMQKMPQQSWCKVGSLYSVKNCSFQATVEGATNRCPCADCVEFFKGRQLYIVYEILSPEADRGRLLFTDGCRVLPD